MELSQSTGNNEISAFRKLILVWFVIHGRSFQWRRKSARNYDRIIAEVLLQRTKAEKVAGHFSTFIKKYPSWKALSEATQPELEMHLHPLGLWRQKASSISYLSKDMAKRHGRIPKHRDEIEALPNVGQYIANAIQLLCHGVPQPLLDTNMSRVLERCFGPRKMADIRYDPYLQQLAKEVVSCKEPIKINWAILDLAALVCKPSNPICPTCPVKKICGRYLLHTQIKLNTFHRNT